ncbi:MAG: DUF4160 domain-containing protein [Hyphomicrobiaceae bacterium]|nr:DUF4160 domain-containing protein [Hyphomicrobiaceae bacterium]
MPTISYFYGIYIRMYLKDHAPPHFHAVYGEYEAYFSIETGALIQGKMPKRARRLVLDWSKLHRDALMQNWARSQSGQMLERVPGLDAEQGD